MTTPTPAEQYMLELINRARLDPVGEAARFGITLNEGLAPGTIAPDPKQPLAWNEPVAAGANQYAQWMLDNDAFGHHLDGSTPGLRARAAGWQAPDFGVGIGENIVLRLGSATIEETILFEQVSFFGSPGHRQGMLAPDNFEVGIGSVVGEFTFPSGAITQMVRMTVQEYVFWLRDDPQPTFLTGVAYRDGFVEDNDFYNPGEGLGGVEVEAVRVEDGAVFSTTTWDTGGYTLQVPSGIYNVTFSHPEFSAKIQRVVVDDENVKFDFIVDVPKGMEPLPEVGMSPAETTDDIFRFFNTQAGGHFFTASEAERDFVQENLSQYRPEGVGFEAFAPDDTSNPQAEEIFRFFNTDAGGHFFTASEAERDFVQDNLPQFTFEGVGFRAFETQVADTVPIFRFFNTEAGGHFFTASVAERDFVQDNLSQFTFEGTGFFAFPQDFGDAPTVVGQGASDDLVMG